jgi:hypothetical protein
MLPPPKKITPEVAGIIRRHFQEYQPKLRTVNLKPFGPVPAVRFRTPGWHYAIIHTASGWELHPPNYSPRYAQLVEQLMKAILEINHEHQ